jgi:arylsulfatase A
MNRKLLPLLVLILSQLMLSASKLPNIVFILADDLGRFQLGCYGSSFYETPHIDALARDGMQFMSAYAAAAVCSPSRASILTGKYPARLHLTDYIPGMNPGDKPLQRPSWTQLLKQSETTVAELLKDAGYVTGHFGKWHLNYDKQYEPGRVGDPGSQGFDDVLTTHKPGAGPKSPYANDWHHVRHITERALAFVETHQDQPFFCYISHNSIHDPEKEREELVQKYMDKPCSDKKPFTVNNPYQAAMLETLDSSVGMMLKKLEDLGLKENTLVIFFSDNGQLGPRSGAPLRGSKADLYEGGIRMPLIVKWPGVVPAGSTSDVPINSNDFLPTLASVAGAEYSVSDIDGLNLLPLLKDPRTTLERPALYWHYPHYHWSSRGPQGAIRKGRYKLIEWFEKRMLGQTGAYELYDLVEDPREETDLVHTMPALVEELSKELDEWRIEVGAQSMHRQN